MQKEKIDCAAWLKYAANGRVIYWLPNHGNAGDSLIAASTASLFRREGIKFRTIPNPTKFNSKGRFVCYGGGGNLVPQYKRARRFLEKHHESAARIVILPHTVRGNEDVLGSLSSRVTIICREAASYAHCKSAAPRAEVLMADDLVFALKPEELLNPQVAAFGLSSPFTWFSLNRVFAKFTIENVGRSELAVWRGGAEMNSLRPYPSQNDISQAFRIRGRRRTLSQMKVSAHFLLRTIDKFSSILTDRLHVAIAATLLGKQVELYPNEYYKNKAVYDFSLSQLPNIRFVDWPHQMRKSPN